MAHSSGLNEYDYGGVIQPYWNNDTILLNSTLLKIGGLLDTDVSGIADGDVLKYNSGTSKWEPIAPRGPYSALLTTTTTSSSSSSSSSTTTSSSSSSTSSTSSSSTTTTSTAPWG